MYLQKCVGHVYELANVVYSCDIPLCPITYLLRSCCWWGCLFKEQGNLHHLKTCLAYVQILLQDIPSVIEKYNHAVLLYHTKTVLGGPLLQHKKLAVDSHV